MASRFGIKFSQWWRHRSLLGKIYDFFLYGFALTGVAIIVAWIVFKLGLTNNRGAVDRNNRYLAQIESENANVGDVSEAELDALWVSQYSRLIALSRFYPNNARLITHAAQQSSDPLLVDKMIAAAEVYIPAEERTYKDLARDINITVSRYELSDRGLAVPWMNTPEWQMLKKAIVGDASLIVEAGRLTGVEPRLIAGCLVGEQIRLFNSKREMVKKYIGPMQVLSVQSQFSFGVNGIKDFTARQVEDNLRDTASSFYMGSDYEHLLDFETADHATERFNRLVDYRNHLYSYIYTGCILHQTMLQWRRAGYDISSRPDILFTLFNVGFSQSQPKPNPLCGGSHIKVDDQWYTFGAIGFDFYYSGELTDYFPIQKEHFISERQSITTEDVERLQDNVSNCRRPERGIEYRTDSNSLSSPTEVTNPSPSSTQVSSSSSPQVEQAATSVAPKHGVLPVPPNFPDNETLDVRPGVDPPQQQPVSPVLQSPDGD